MAALIRARGVSYLTFSVGFREFRENSGIAMDY